MILPRLDWDSYFMVMAHVVGTRATCDRGPKLRLDPDRSGTGALIALDRRAIATGYNGSPSGLIHCDQVRCPRCGRIWPIDVDKDHQPGVQCPICDPDESADDGKRFCVLEGGHEMDSGHCIRTIHAEENALLQCAQVGVPVAGATLYVTTKPCYRCFKRVIQAGIARVVYDHQYASGEDADKVMELAKNINFLIEKWSPPDGLTF